MIFNDEISAVDWIFCYGNEALAKLEMFPLKKLIGQKFSVLFENMDSDWLRFYEKAVLYGEIMEINHYSPEIDAFLKVICFPTFRWHCGCIYFIPMTLMCTVTMNLSGKNMERNDKRY